MHQEQTATFTARPGRRRIEPGMLAAGAIETARGTGYAVSFTYMALYLHTQRGLAMTTVGIVMLSSGILSGLFQILGGMLADRYGHRRLFVLFEAGELAAIAAIASLIATHAPLWSIVVAGIVSPVLGVTAGTCMSAIIADISAKDRMTESYGLLAIAGNIGWAIGPMTGGFLLGVASYGWLFATGASIIGLSLAGVPFLPRGKEVTDSRRVSVRSVKTLLADRHLVIFCAMSLLLFIAMAQWGSTLSVFTTERMGMPTERYGLLMSISGLLIVAFQYPISRRIEKLGLRKALVLGSVLYGIGFLSFAWVKTFAPAIGSIVVLVAGEMLFFPAALAMVGKLSGARDRGKNMGLLGMASTLGNSVGPLLGGCLFDAFPTNAVFLWGAIGLSCFLAAAGYLVWGHDPAAE